MQDEKAKWEAYEAELDAGPPEEEPFAIRAGRFLGKQVPERRWLVNDIIPFGNVSNLSGDGGVGKSLAGLMLGCALVVPDKQWLGFETMKGPVIYFGAEDDIDELHRRLEDIREHMDISWLKLVDLYLVVTIDKEPVLGTFETGTLKPTTTFLRLEELVTEVKPVVVVLDTTADIFAGNENDRLQVRQFTTMLRGLALRNETTILTLSHPSLSGLQSGSGRSGSTGWSNSVRARLYLTHSSEKDDSTGEPLDPDARLLECKKCNYGPIAASVKLRWSKGVFVIDDKAEGRSIMTEVIFLQLLDAYAAEGRDVGAARAMNYAPTVFARDPRAQRTTKKQFEVAMNEMFASGEIAVEECGPPSRRRTRIVRAK